MTSSTQPSTPHAIQGWTITNGVFVAVALVSAMLGSQPWSAMAQAPVGQAGAPRGPAQAAAGAPVPPPFQLTPEQEQRVQQILEFWEHRTAKIKVFTCQFDRWEYDKVFGVMDADGKPVAKTVCKGTIRYASPDKGEFDVTEVGQYQEGAGGKADYPAKPVSQYEHWICDGNSVYEFNGEGKILTEARLPANAKGQAITDGPLPFLFNAKKEKILARFWVRELKPLQQGQFVLQAVPKTAFDAGNFDQIVILIDEKEFLPTGMQMVTPGGQARLSYVFRDRKVNGLVGNLKEFAGSFIRPDLPRGWRKNVEDYRDPNAAIQAMQAQQPGSSRDPAAAASPNANPGRQARQNTAAPPVRK
ncbi:MAG: hypothetical protein R3E01_15875 [Pirellulaceae bacterium]|nr:hypothetical protein [Planctomycetales bacterium]